MKLNELFSSSISGTIIRDDNNELHISAVIGTKQIYFKAEHDGGDWWILFGANYTDSNDPRAASHRRFDFTNDFQAPKVLAFIKSCIEQLVKRHAPKTMRFSANKGRQDVYRRMLTRFIPKDIYEVSEDIRANRSVLFTVTRKDAI